MRWYKHKTESLNDPDISDIVDEFGGDGYMVFFGILELMGRNWNQNQNGKVTFSFRFLRKNLRINSKRMQLILNFKSFSKRISSELKDGDFTFYCQEFKDLLDNWTGREDKKEQPKLGSNSVVTTTLNRSKKVEVDTDKDKDIKTLKEVQSTESLSQEKLNEVKINKEKKERYLKFVFLSPQENLDFTTQYGKTITEDYIARLDDYIEQIGEAAAGKKYKSHRAVIQNWLRRDGIKKKSETDKEGDY